jgi:isoleucyl-tRNA synthetase
MFKEVPSQFDFPKAEKEILAFWEANKIYEKSLAQRKGATPFIFFEGPPTANGLPHPGHCLTRAIKDLFPRYKTMTGHYCLRKGGWDTHGLPVEVEVCKELGIHTKEEIEKYGVEAFNKKCLESVFRYTKEWAEMTRRLGFCVNLEEAYVTYHQSYIESVWWSLKQLFDAGLLYQGHKIVWWWAQGGTALSAGEVGQGYREVDDPSVYVRFPIVIDERAKKAGIPEKTNLLVWTTTPWTLPSNTFAAVHKDFEYALVHDEETGERLIFAAAHVEQIAKKAKRTEKWKVETTVKGSALVGLSYRPPFDYYRKRPAHEIVPHAERGITLGDYKPELVAGGSEFACWRILHADFVSLDSGTGLVHEAPAFGEVDFDLLQEERKRFRKPGENLRRNDVPIRAGVGAQKSENHDFEPAPSIISRINADEFTLEELKEMLSAAEYMLGESIPLLCAVAPDGTFTDDVPQFKGRWVKDCDKDIIRDMKERGLLLHQEQYRHDYPFCWRAEEDPLIQYPRKSWFIRTTQFKEAMLENNRQINWLPEHIKEGRFGNFLKDNVDWSLSRERYWGTPLPIWVCENCQYMQAVDSYEALRKKSGTSGFDDWENAKKKAPHLSDHLMVHKPYIDAITYNCPKCEVLYPQYELQSRMRRVPEVIDCWYDAGAMPFAQWGYPHKDTKMFADQYPADFISEALDQTRGWFYSLVAISTLLFGKNGIVGKNGQWPLPFRNCIVLGLLMGEDGLKMSKSKKNYKEPTYIFEHEGADAMRWLFFSGQTPWTSIRFQESAIAEGQREFLIRLYNCYSFFVIYANIDSWTPDQSRDPKGTPSGAVSELDRWIRSELTSCSVRVFDAMEKYDNYTAARALIGFVDALSNWYVRRSRDRFWRGGMDADKNSAYQTLYDCLVTTAKLIAPFTPFFAENLYQNLVRTHQPEARESVHLCDYPVLAQTRGDVERRIDRALNDEIEHVRQVVSCGRAARAATKLRVRQPLARMEVYHRQATAIRKYESVIKDELNVKRIDWVEREQVDQYVNYELKPDFKKLGPKFGPQAPKIKAALAKHPNATEIIRQLSETGSYSLALDSQQVELSTDELIIELHAKEGWAAERIPGQGILVLDTYLTPELLDEGLARDLVNQIQQVRSWTFVKHGSTWPSSRSGRLARGQQTRGAHPT